jgi:DNA-binding PadR family transcriptional regulator
VTRIFSRGELKQVLLTVVSSLEEGHGYAIMRELQRRVGTDWRPSPGAIYPALVALETSGLIVGTDRDGLRVYSLTDDGNAALEDMPGKPEWRALSSRVAASKPQLTLGRLLERFDDNLPARKQRLTDEQAKTVQALLDETAARITRTFQQGENDG